MQFSYHLSEGSFAGSLLTEYVNIHNIACLLSSEACLYTPLTSIGTVGRWNIWSSSDCQKYFESILTHGGIPNTAVTEATKFALALVDTCV